jgi:hypothetical protein
MRQRLPGAAGGGQGADGGDKSHHPGARDAKKKALIESWGYTVEVISESANQSEIDTAVSNNDVVYVSNTVNSSQLGNRLAGVPIGVISEDGDYNSDFGTSSGAGWTTGSAVDVIDNSHYITALFPSGALPIYAANMEGLIATGTMATDLQTLSNWGSDPGLAAVETGGLLADGSSTAAGRRVMLPLGRDGSFNWDYLNNNGRLIVQRALQWGTGNTGGTPPKNLLFVSGGSTLVQVPSGDLLVIPTAQEQLRIDLIEPWGYTVNLISENDTQANFDAAVAANDVAYVPANISEANLAQKLSYASIGIVNEANELHQELGLQNGGSGTTTGSQIDIIDNTHYITEVFPTGALTITISGQSLNRSAGNLGEATILANTTDPGLAVIETGSTLKGVGGIAAARRAFLPWGGLGFDFSALNADGQTIMQRAIEWASSSPGLAGPIAHWKLDETSGIMAVDSVGGHDGTLSNGPSWTTGQLDGGLDFDGGDDTINAGSDATIDDVFAGGATLSAWINPRGWGEGDFGRIADKADALGTNRNGWAFELYGANRALLFQYGFSGGIGNWYTPVDSISLDTWHHVVVVYDNSSDANDPLIYIDGVLQTLTELDTPSGSPSSDAAVDFTIGNYALANSRTFDGVLDDVRLYDRMLDATEIAALAAGGGGGGGGPPPGGGGCDGTFRDEFNAVSYSNNDGTLTWATDWLEINESDGANKGDERVTSSALRVRDNDGGGEGVQREADMSGAAAATLSFDYKRVALDSLDDYVTVEISASGATGPWTELDRFEGAADDSGYQPVSYDITAYVSNDTRIRFLSSSDLGGQDMLRFDNVQIQCTP